MDTRNMTANEVRLAWLVEIKETADSVRNYPIDRNWTTLATAALIFVPSVAASVIPPGLRLISDSGGLNALAWAIVAALAALVVFRLHPARSKLVERLDQQLADYEPVDRAGYLQLQQAVRQAGSLKPDLIAEWIAKERDAVQARSLQDHEVTPIDLPPRSKFLSRACVSAEASSSALAQPVKEST